MSVDCDHVRILIVVQIRHDLTYSGGDVPVDQDLGIAVDVSGYEHLQGTLSDGEHESCQQIHLDSGVCLVLAVLVTVAVRIVEFILVRVDQNIVVRALSEVDLRIGDLNIDG